MAIGGRNLVASWIVGVICCAFLVLVLWVAWPFFPVVGDWFVSLFHGFFDWLRSITPARTAG